MSGLSFFFGLFCFHSTQLGLIVLIWSISRFHIHPETLGRPLVANLAFRPLVEVESEAVYAAVVHFVGKQESALCIVGKLGEASMAFLQLVSGDIHEKIVSLTWFRGLELFSKRAISSQSIIACLMKPFHKTFQCNILHILYRTPVASNPILILSHHPLLPPLVIYNRPVATPCPTQHLTSNVQFPSHQYSTCSHHLRKRTIMSFALATFSLVFPWPDDLLASCFPQ